MLGALGTLTVLSPEEKHHLVLTRVMIYAPFLQNGKGMRTQILWLKP